MKTLLGYVLVKETNLGIPNLVVSAYDCEKTLQELFAVNQDKKRSLQFPLGSVKQLGQRIGSVLTNGDGRFLLTSEDLKFEGIESRPDLLIVVFAPEDVQGPDKPYPLPPEQRILYISSVPRDDAGCEEAFIIRLLQSQYDSLIPSNASQNKVETESLRLRNAIERAYIFRDNFKAALAPRLKAQVATTNRFKELAKGKLKNFSTVPQALRDHPLFIRDPAQLKATHTKAINAGLARLSGYAGSMQVSLTPQALESYGLRVDKNGEITGNLKTATLLELIKQTTASVGGIDLIRIRDLNDKSLEATWKRYTSEKRDQDAGKRKGVQ